MLNTPEDRINYINNFKSINHLILDTWEDFGIEMPSEEVVSELNTEIKSLCNFLILQLEKEVENLQTQVQLYFNAWKTESYEQMQVELLVDVMNEPLQAAGVDVERLII